MRVDGGDVLKKFGIDISVWQGNFNMEQAKKEGVEFVIVKGGGGDAGLYVDKQFENNYKKAKQLNLPVGCYWFSRALTVKEAEKEAEYFYRNCLKNKQFELPIYIDVENKTQLAVGQRMLTDIVKAWIEWLKDKGFLVGIYSSLYYINRKVYDSELQNYAHWIAQWNKTLDYAHKDICGMWQFGGETNFIRTNKVAGVVCDQDYMLFDYPAYVKENGLNGFGENGGADNTGKSEKNATCTVELPILRRGVNSGYVRTAQVLLNRYNKAGLIEDGGFGSATEKAVIAYQKSRGLAVDGVIGKQTWAQLIK